MEIGGYIERRDTKMQKRSLEREGEQRKIGNRLKQVDNQAKVHYTKRLKKEKKRGNYIILYNFSLAF